MALPTDSHFTGKKCWSVGLILNRCMLKHRCTDEWLTRLGEDLMFETNFDPKRDVLYGLSETRDQYLDKWLAAKQKELKDQNAYSGIALVKLEEAAQKALINYWNRPLSMAEVEAAILTTNVDKIIREQASRTSSETYMDELLVSRLSPTRIQGEPLHLKLAKNNVHIPTKQTQFQQFRQNDKSKEIEKAAVYLAIRRACKFGMEYVMAFKSGRIHYILDKIAMQEVLNKHVRTLGNGSTGVPITTSELRFLFRNWHWFRGKLGNTLIFWDQDAIVNPPWCKEPELWISYAHYLLSKYETAKSKEVDYDAQGVLAFRTAAQTSAAEGIKAYSDVPLTEEICLDAD